MNSFNMKEAFQEKIIQFVMTQFEHKPDNVKKIIVEMLSNLSSKIGN